MGKEPLEGCTCIFAQGPPSSKLRHCTSACKYNYEIPRQRVPCLSAPAVVFFTTGRYINCIPFCVFLPPDAVRWRGICYGDVAVCVSVWLSVCLSR